MSPQSFLAKLLSLLLWITQTYLLGYFFKISNKNSFKGGLYKLFKNVKTGAESVFFYLPLYVIAGT